MKQESYGLAVESKTVMTTDRALYRVEYPLGASIAAMLGLFLLVAPVAGQAPQPPADSERAADPLAARQQIVRDRMVQLEDRMFRLAEKLAENDPEQARRLADALRNTGELLIRRNMEEAIGLLEQAELADAADRQVAVEKALEQVLKVLLEEPDLSKELQEEIERLKELSEQLDKLLEQQRELENRTRESIGLSQRLSAAVARLQQLITRQQAEIDKSHAAAAGQRQGLDLRASQAQVRRETEELTDELKAVANAAQAPEAGADRPREERPGEPSPREPAEPQAHEDHPHDDKPTGADKPSDAEAEAARQASSALQRATDEMKSAESQLQQAGPSEAGGAQNEAMKALQEAMEALRQAAEAQARPMNAADAARQQRGFEKQASRLADEMQGREQAPGTQPAGERSNRPETQPEQGEQARGEQENEDESGKQSQRPPTPGGQNVRNASQHMNRAAGNLDRQQQEQGSQEQQQAIEELERAQDELRQALDQLRREQQEEMLRGLEQRFRAMLAGQKAVNEATSGLAARDAQAWTRSDLLGLAGLAQDEKKLSDEAAAALNLLVEEATTIVFPQVVAQMRDDMLEVARRLAEKDTGEITRQIEIDIVTTLEELVEAMKQRQSEMAEAPPPGQPGDQGQSEQQQQQQENPLLPGSAELKLLKSSQVRVNRQTRGVEESRADAEPVSSKLQRELDRLAKQQDELADMARKMNERATGQ